MPVQPPQWTDYLSCPICCNIFNENQQRPISLGCGHTVCKTCLSQLPQKRCPYDQNQITRSVEELPANFALLQLVGVAAPEGTGVHDEKYVQDTSRQYYSAANKCIEELAMYLKPLQPSEPQKNLQPSSSTTPANSSILSRPMQRKLVVLVNCQLIEEEGRARAVRAARSLGERAVTELLLQHQNPQQLSANLWAAVRARGCQFLGPAMQEEVLKLILLALEDGSALSRKVLVLFVVQRLESQYPQASKTAIGHVVQLLYRASCFKVTKREEESSLMQLKEEFRTYETLRREHDSQIVQIATEAGLRIVPDQWSSLLYGDTAHKSHMQSIIDKLQTPQSFSQSVNELMLAVQRSGDQCGLTKLKPHLEALCDIDPTPETSAPTWEMLDAVMTAIKTVVNGLAEFLQHKSNHKVDPTPVANPKYKTSLCRDMQLGGCPRGANCTFAHSQEELEKYRAKNKKGGKPVTSVGQKSQTTSALTVKERQELAAVVRSSDGKLLARVTQTQPLATSHAVCSIVTTVTASDQGPRVSACRRSVHVPIVKPYNLPPSANANVRNPTIYSTPTPTLEDQRPGLIPVTHRHRSVSSNHMSSRGASPASTQYQQTLPASFYPSASSGFVDSGMQHLNYEAHVQASMQHTPAPAMTPIKAEEEFLRSTVALPPNPYLTDVHRLGDQQWIGKRSPTEQLNELHRRRKELLVQLNKGKGSGKMHTTPTSDHFLVCDPSFHHTSAASSGVCTHLADSVSCTHTALSFANGGQRSAQEGDYSAVVHEDDLEPDALSPLSHVVSAPDSSVTPMTADYDVAFQEEGSADAVYPTSSQNQMCEEGVEDACAQQMDTYFYDDDPVVSSETAAVALSTIQTLSFDEEEDVPVEGDYLDSDCEKTLWRSERIKEHPGDNLEDEFIPFQHTVVSKYGPISRTARARVKNTWPIMVSAQHNSKETYPVTAVTPMQRPYPVSSQVPSRYQAGGVVHSDHIADPRGNHVASSLPTAFMRPNVMSSMTDTHTLWDVQENITPFSYKLRDASRREAAQIRKELLHINKQIEHLKVSEDERMARELQAIELNIQETERQLEISAHPYHRQRLDYNSDVALAQAYQELQHATEIKRLAIMEEKKKMQEIQDRRLAEQLVLSEAREKGMSLATKNMQDQTRPQGYNSFA